MYKLTLKLCNISSSYVLDQLANLHSDTLRDLAPMERSNGIPMEIFRLVMYMRIFILDSYTERHY